MQLPNSIIDMDEDGWVGAAPELWMPKSEEPAAALARPDVINTQSEARSSQSIRHQTVLPLKPSKGTK